MKPYYLILLIFLPACSTAPKLALHPVPTPALTDTSAIRYPEIVRAYHLGRYVDPNNDLVMHEQHVVYRVEENTRWDFHPGPAQGFVSTSSLPTNAAYSPVAANDDILAQVNSQKIATAQIMAQARMLAAALAQFQSALQQTKTNLQATTTMRATLSNMQKRLDALESAEKAEPPTIQSTTTNGPPDSLEP